MTIAPVTLLGHRDTAGRLRIEVEDSGARYPIAIDPLLMETADTPLESHQMDSRLGTSVSAAGDLNGDGYADEIELLDDLIGTDPSTQGLAEAIRARTGGNPFSTEEIVRSPCARSWARPSFPTGSVGALHRSCWAKP